MHRYTRWAVIGSTAALLVLAASSMLTQDAPQATSPAPAAAPVEAARFGPGVFPASSYAMPAGLDTEAPGGLAVSADRHLVVNKALRDVFDYFLLGGHPGERSQHVARLFAHLRSTLPSPAYEEATRIAQNYLTYLDEHDKLLPRTATPQVAADVNAPVADLDRIAAWIAQRARLRQSILGIEVAHIWYGDEETELEKRLADMRNRTQTRQTIDDPVQQTMANLNTLRAQGASEQTQRALIADRFGEAAAQRFDALEREEQAWQQRYAAYRREAERIHRQAGLADSDRMQQIDALRAQMFPAEPERLRVQALDARAGS